MTTRQAENDVRWQQLVDQEMATAPADYLQPGDILSEEGDAPMRVSDLRYKGYVEVWNTRTGDKSLQPYWLLHQTRAKRFTDGPRELVYTDRDPQIPPDHGMDLFCPLNPLAPENKRFSGRGFQPCRKKHIPNEDALARHIKKSHSRAYEAMEQAQKQRERDEDRAMQRELIESNREIMAALAVGAVANATPGAKAR